MSRRPIPKSMRFRVLRRDGFKCRYCGAMPPDVVLHLDHVMPVANGGMNSDDNLVTACLPCNIGKGVMSADLPVYEIVGGAELVRPRPRVEFFWSSNYDVRPAPVDDARCIEFPEHPEETHPWEWQEFNRYWYSRKRKWQYSTHGASTSGFSPYEAAMYAAEIMAMPWSSHAAYFNFADDLIEQAGAGRLPQYIAPNVLRGLHPELVTFRCGRMKPDHEDLADYLAKQAVAVFQPFLDREHVPWRRR